MFESIRIENYKAFRSLEVDGLRRINIFMGGNNSGKSCLLEAVSLLADIWNATFLYDCNIGRGLNKMGNLAYFFNDMNIENTIVLRAVGELNAIHNREIRMSLKHGSVINGSIIRSVSSQCMLELKRRVDDLELQLVEKDSYGIETDSKTMDNFVSQMHTEGHNNCAFMTQKSAMEIDNGLHHSVMRNTWRTIAQMAEKHNVQIFATTHSMDTLKGIKEGFDKEKVDELFTFCALLKKDSGDNMAFPLSYSELSSDIDMGNDFR